MKYKPAQTTLFPEQGVPVTQNQRPSAIKYILEEQKLRTRQDLFKLRVAVDQAESTSNPDRELLHDIYRDIILDPNLSSQWESRKMKTKEKQFKMVNKQGEEDKEVTMIFEASWFLDFIDAALDSKLWGFSLIEFGTVDKNRFNPYSVNGKQYDAVTCIDRDNVKPELRLITPTPHAMTGLSFEDPEVKDYLLFVGKYRGFGILHQAAKYILFKDNALGNWSEWAEVFGMDKRIGYTASQGPQREAFLRAIRDIGANAYGVFTERDKVEYLGTQRTDAYGVYNELVKLIDEQISKLIFGQDVVTNNTGKVVGSVGENISNMYGDNDARFIKHLVNDKLIPLMENLGFNFKGLTFDWDVSEKLSLAERAAIDLQIFQMGKTHSDEYINTTYGTQVETKEDPEAAPIKVKEALAAMYGGDI